MKQLDVIKFIFEIIAIVLTLGGLVFAYVDSKQDRNEAAYRKLGDSYNQILTLCMEDYKLDCYDIPLDSTFTLGREQLQRQTIIYTMLINHFEQAFKLIRFNEDVWPGWEDYFDQYFVRIAFLEVWKNFQGEWSISFQEYINFNVIKPLVEDNKIPKHYQSFFEKDNQQ